MKRMVDSVKKRLMLLSMVVVMMTGTIVPGYVETVQAETTVYVTRTGSKYHTHKCGNGTYYSATRSEAWARGLTPCKKCFPNGDSAGSSSSGSSGSSKKTPVKTMKINKSAVEMVKGQTALLKVSNAPGSVKWSSSDTSVVTVSSSGKVTAKAKGRVTITVTSGSQKKQCKVTVEDPSLSKETLDMELDEVASLKLTGCKHEIAWYSSNTDVVSVDEGQVAAEGVGKAVVKARVHGKMYSCKVTVKKPEVQSISVGDYDAVMECSDWQKVELLIKPFDITDYYDVSVTSSDPSIVSADFSDDWGGTYVELYSEDTPGQATITVSVGGKSASFTVETVSYEDVIA